MTAIVESDKEKREILSHIGVRAILAHLKGALTFSWKEWYSKDLLLEYVIYHAFDKDLHFLLQAGHNKLAEKTECSGQIPSWKHKWAEESSIWCTAWRVEKAGSNPMDINNDDYKSEKFLVLPTKQELKDCYAQFYCATSNATLRSGICSICAQECSFITDQLKDIPLFQLSNSNHLIPTKPHFAHQLFDERLLKLTGVRLTVNPLSASVTLALKTWRKWAQNHQNTYLQIGFELALLHGNCRSWHSLSSFWLHSSILGSMFSSFSWNASREHEMSLDCNGPCKKMSAHMSSTQRKSLTWCRVS